MRWPLLNLDERSLELVRDDVPHPAELLVPEHILLVLGEDHLDAVKRRALRDQRHAVLAGIGIPVLEQELAQLLDVELVLGNHAPVRRACHRGKKRSETGIASEDLDDEEALVASRGGAERVGHLDGAGDASAETDAIVGPGNVIVHGLGDRDHPYSLLMEPHRVRKGVVSSDRDEGVDPEPFEVLQSLLAEVVHLVLVLVAEVRRHFVQGDVARPGARGVEEGTAGAANLVHNLLGELHHHVASVEVVAPNELDEPRPSAADAENAVAFTKRPNGERANRRIQPGNVAAAGENPDGSFFRPNVCHTPL